MVIDFGGATYDDERKSSIVNTRQYRAPEGHPEPGLVHAFRFVVRWLYRGGVGQR